MILTPQDKKNIEKIKKLAFYFYSQQDFAHDENHGMRVSAYAKEIMKFETADSFLVAAGAWLHQFHDNLEELEELLKSLPIKTQKKQKLYHIASVCHPQRISKSQSIEAKIVYDADALAVISSHGLIREIICNAVVRKMSWDENIQRTQEVQNIFINTLQTKGAKKIAKSTTEICANFWKDYKSWELFLEPAS